MTRAASTAIIAGQNDAFRRSLGTAVPGRFLLMWSIARLPPDDVAQILAAVRAFAAFTPDNDPHGERDFGRFVAAGQTCFWKIDYYADASLTFGADDATASYRVLTVMLAEEY